MDKEIKNNLCMSLFRLYTTPPFFNYYFNNFINIFHDVIIFGYNWIAINDAIFR